MAKKPRNPRKKEIHGMPVVSLTAGTGRSYFFKLKRAKTGWVWEKLNG